MVKQAIERSESSGAAIDVVALAAVRATREARVQRGREELPSIIGTPAAGESAGGTTFDGNTEAATFPGDLPDDPASAVRRGQHFQGPVLDRPRQCRLPLPALPPAAAGARPNGEPALPHIRMDRALQFLIGDRLE